MTARVRWLAGAAIAGVLLAGCSADCICVAPTAVIHDPADAYQAGTTIEVALDGLYASCCTSGGSWPWSSGEPDVMSEVTLTLEAVDTAGTELDTQTVAVADDATATITLTIPDDAASGTATIVLDGLPETTITIAG